MRVGLVVRVVACLVPGGGGSGVWCRGWLSGPGVPVYPIGGYVGILGMAADRGEKGVSTGVKAEARLH